MTSAEAALRAAGEKVEKYESGKVLSRAAPGCSLFLVLRSLLGGGMVSGVEWRVFESLVGLANGFLTGSTGSTGSGF